MEGQKYQLVLDKVLLKQLKKLEKDKALKSVIAKMLNKIEGLGPLAGKLLHSQFALFEVKSKRPPIRLYYRINETKKEAHVFEFEMKTSQARQQQTIERIKKKIGSEA